MGTIARQTLKGSVYSYIGALIGFVNVAVLMPHIFSTQEVGLTNILISISAIFGQFGTLGFVNVTTRLFPYFRNKDKKHSGFLFLSFVAGFTGFFICLLIFHFSKSYLISQNIESSPLFVEYIYLLIPLIFITIFYLLIDTYNRVLFNASFGAFVKEFLLRILNFSGILLFYFDYFSFHDFIIFYTAVYAVPVILICILLIYRGEFSLKPSLSFLNPFLRKEIPPVAIFGIIAGFSGIAAMHIDRYMVNHFCDLSATGVYATAFFFGTIILLPGRALLRIASSSITEAFKNNDSKTVSDIYAKSTINQMLIAGFIFLLIWTNIESIMQILPPEYAEGKFVIFYISLAYFIFMSGGLSSEIIQFSKYYKEYTAIMLILIVCIVVFNLIFIPLYGITGAAIASCLSYLIYSIIKYVFILIKFKYQPFGAKHFLTVLIIAGSFFIVYIIPHTELLIIDLAIKSLACLIVFAIPVYLLKLSPDANKIMHSIIAYFNRNQK